MMLPKPIVNSLLLAHLFVCCVCLTANFSPSRFQEAVLQSIKYYAQPLNLQLHFTRYQLVGPYAGIVDGQFLDNDQRIEILPAGGDPEQAEDWIVFHESSWKGSEAYQRKQRLADRMALFVLTGDEDNVARVATAAASHYVSQGVEVEQIRVRMHHFKTPQFLQSDLPEFETLYAANVVVSAEDRVEIVKIEDVSQVADPKPR